MSVQEIGKKRLPDFRLTLIVISQFGIALSISLVLILAGCTAPQSTDQATLVQVGDKLITVDDFRFNYEFGLPHLKKGDNPKQAYLEFLIGEELLAKAGYSLDLNKSDRVKRLEAELLEELLVEEFFREEVHRKITITPEEIDEAIRQSKVTWKLRYWVESNFDFANNISVAMRESGYSEVVDAILGSNPEIGIAPADLETGYLNSVDISPALLVEIKDLPVGDISNPIEIDGVYFIFQVVDIRREPLIADDYHRYAERYRQILFYRKVREGAMQFVSNYMTPKEVITKGEPFRLLADALFEWGARPAKSSADFLEALQDETDQESAIYALQLNLDEILVTFVGGEWTIREFLSRYYSPSDLNITDRHSFRTQLSDDIALEVRNYFFTTEAQDRNLDQAPSVQHELISWRDKWVYEEARNHYTKNIHLTDAQIREFFSNNSYRYKIRRDTEPIFEDFARQAQRDGYIEVAQKILTRTIDSLKTVYPVIINQAVLDTITVTRSQKSRWLSVQVFKQSSKRMAQPIVDPVWGL